MLVTLHNNGNSAQLLYGFYIFCIFQGVEERDREIKKSREECLKMQQSMEEQLAEERTNNQDNQVGTVTLGEENKKVMEEVKKQQYLLGIVLLNLLRLK